MNGIRDRIRGLKGNHRGAALVEFALVLPVLLIMLLLILELGFFIQSRLIITNVSREGGSIASRELDLDQGILTLLEVSGHPLDLAGADGRIYVTRIEAGLTEQDPQPTIERQFSSGGLGVGSSVAAGVQNLGLTQALYDRLVFDPADQTADISELTIVEIYYKYRPVTPLQNLLQDVVLNNGDGTIIASRAIF
jgi:hypothetical protein